MIIVKFLSTAKTTENSMQPLQSGDDTKDRQMAKEASSESLLRDSIFAPDTLSINIQYAKSIYNMLNQ